MTDAQGNQLTYAQIAERMTLRPWDEGEPRPPNPTTGDRAISRPAGVLKRREADLFTHIDEALAEASQA
jgi:hypothetical protein